MQNSLQDLQIEWAKYGTQAHLDQSIEFDCRAIYTQNIADFLHGIKQNIIKAKDLQSAKFLQKIKITSQNIIMVFENDQNFAHDLWIRFTQAQWLHAQKLVREDKLIPLILFEKEFVHNAESEEEEIVCEDIHKQIHDFSKNHKNLG